MLKKKKKGKRNQTSLFQLHHSNTVLNPTRINVNIPYIHVYYKMPQTLVTFLFRYYTPHWVPSVHFSHLSPSLDTFPVCLLEYISH